MSVGQYRYPGPKEFEDTPADHALFCGRADEVRTITQQIVASRLLVLYAYSGFGKSSLLKAGVCPRLRDQNYFPIRVRLSASPLMKLIADSCAEASRDFDVDYTPGEGNTPWEFFKTAMFWRKGTLLYPVMIFDQFEEIFTLVDESWRKSFAEAIGPLASGNLPASLRERQSRGDLGLSDSAPKVKIIFSLREEYYGSLQELSGEFPALFQDRFRLLAMKADQAIAAITNPASRQPTDTFGFKTSPFEYTPDTVKAMVEFLQGRNGTIEPFQLQLLCQHVERNVAERKQDSAQNFVCITPGDIGGEQAMSAIVQRFYTDSLNELPLRERRHAQELCDTGLLSSDGHRLMLRKDEILRDYEVSDKTLQHLIEKRILREEPRLDSLFYEIGHDTIAKSILRTRPRRLPKKWLPVLKASAVFLLAVTCGAIWFIHSLQVERTRAQEGQQQAIAAQNKTERLVAFLIGEELLEKIRPLGKLEILDQIQGKVEDTYCHGAGNEDCQKLSGDANDTQLRNFGLMHLNKGDLHYARYDSAEAESEYKIAETSFEKLLSRNSQEVDWLHDLADAKGKLAQVFEDELQLSSSEKLTNDALAIQQSLIERRAPALDSVLRDKAKSYLRLGEILQKQVKLSLAYEEFEKAAMLAPPGACTDQYKGELEWLYVRQDALTGEGEISGRQQRTEAAMKSLEDARRCAEEAVRRSPFSPEAHYRVGTAANELANLTKEHEEAIKEYIEVNRDVAQAATWDATNVQWQRDLAATYMLLGDGYAALGDHWDAAAKSYKAGVDILRQLLREHPHNTILKLDLVSLYRSIGYAEQSTTGAGANWIRNLASQTDEMATGQPRASATAALESFGGKNQAAANHGERVVGTTARVLLGDATVGAKPGYDALRQYESALSIINEIKEDKKVDVSDEELRDTATGLLWWEASLWRSNSENEKALEVSERGLKALGEKPVDPTDGDYKSTKAGLLEEQARANEALGRQCLSRSDFRQAEKYYAQAEQAWRSAISWQPQDATYNGLFLLYYDYLAPLRTAQKDQAGTLNAYREAAITEEQAIARSPNAPVYHLNLAYTFEAIGDRLRTAGELTESDAIFAKAEHMLRAETKIGNTAENWDAMSTLFLSYISKLRADMKNKTGLLDAYRQAVKAEERAVALQPRNTGYISSLALAHELIGGELSTGGQLGQAGDSYAKAIEYENGIIRLDPSNAKHWERLYGIFHNSVAPLRMKQNDVPGELEAYTSGLGAIQHAVELNPTTADYYISESLAHWRIGRILHDQGKIGPAAEAYMQTERDLRKAIETDGLSVRYYDLSLFLVEWLAPFKAEQHDKAGESRALREGRDAALQAVKLEAGNAAYQYAAGAAALDSAAGLLDAGNFSEAHDAYSEAERYLRESVRLKQDDAGYWYELCQALAGLGQFYESTGNQASAKKNYEEAVRIVSKSMDLDQSEASYRTYRAQLEAKIEKLNRN